MSTQANSKQALGSIFAAVATTAGTITSTLDAANKGIGMLNSTISDAAARQSIRSKLDMAKYAEQATRDCAMEESLSELQVLEFCKISPEHKDLYSKSYTRFSEILNPA